jgi:valyl-tRNA synthetase
VRTGGDTLLSDEVMKNGNRLVTKLWNAAKLALPHLDGYQLPAEAPVGLNATDRWLLARLHAVIRRATAAMDDYEFAAAKAEVERFFWTDLCDNYLEMVKFRLYGDAEGAAQDDGAGHGGREAARYTLANALLAVLKLLAPFLPHVTDAVYGAGMGVTDVLEGPRAADAATAGGTAGQEPPSIHVARWPVARDAWSSPQAERAGQAIVEVAEAVRRWKAERQLSVGAPLGSLRVAGPAEVHEGLESAMLDLRSVTRAARIELVAADEGGVSVSVEQQEDSEMVGSEDTRVATSGK